MRICVNQGKTMHQDVVKSTFLDIFFFVPKCFKTFQKHIKPIPNTSERHVWRSLRLLLPPPMPLSRLEPAGDTRLCGCRLQNFRNFFKKSKIFDFFQKSYFGPKCIKTMFLDALTAANVMPHPNIAPKSPYGHHRVPKIRKNVETSKIYDFFKSHISAQNA